MITRTSLSSDMGCDHMSPESTSRGLWAEQRLLPLQRCCRKWSEPAAAMHNVPPAKQRALPASGPRPDMTSQHLWSFAHETSQRPSLAAQSSLSSGIWHLQKTCGQVLYVACKSRKTNTTPENLWSALGNPCAARIRARLPDKVHQCFDCKAGSIKLTGTTKGTCTVDYMVMKQIVNVRGQERGPTSPDRERHSERVGRMNCCRDSLLLLLRRSIAMAATAAKISVGSLGLN